MKTKEQVTCKMIWGLSLWEVWHWDDNNSGWLGEEVEYVRNHKMYTSVPRKACLRETERHPSRQDGR